MALYITMHYRVLYTYAPFTDQPKLDRTMDEIPEVSKACVSVCLVCLSVCLHICVCIISNMCKKISCVFISTARGTSYLDRIL